jgi:hypothetical protein
MLSGVNRQNRIFVHLLARPAMARACKPYGMARVSWKAGPGIASTTSLRATRRLLKRQVVWDVVSVVR